MHREQNVTALYRRFESADLVREGLRADGIELARIHVIPDRVIGIDDASDLDLYDSILADLELPEEDTRTYQTAVRRGDFVVSVTVAPDEVPRVEEIMRHPEAVGDRVERDLATEAPPLVGARPVDLTGPMGR